MQAILSCVSSYKFFFYFCLNVDNPFLMNCERWHNFKMVHSIFNQLKNGFLGFKLKIMMGNVSKRRKIIPQVIRLLFLNFSKMEQIVSKPMYQPIPQNLDRNLIKFVFLWFYEFLVAFVNNLHQAERPNNMLEPPLLLFYNCVFLDGNMFFVPENRPFFLVKYVLVALILLVKINVLLNYLLL